MKYRVKCITCDNITKYVPQYKILLTWKMFGDDEFYSLEDAKLHIVKYIKDAQKEFDKLIQKLEKSRVEYVYCTESELFEKLG